FDAAGVDRALPAFPTRRSSDLGLEAEDGNAVGGVPFGRAVQGAGAGEPGLTCSVVGVDLGEERVDLLPVAVGQDCVPAGDQFAVAGLGCHRVPSCDETVDNRWAGPEESVGLLR